MCQIMAINRIDIDADIARAWSLPAHYYRAAEIAAAERDVIFARTWQVVGHCSRIPHPGDYFTTELMDEPLLIVRGARAKLTVFTTFAGIAAVLLRKAAARESSSGAATTDGPMIWMAT